MISERVRGKLHHRLRTLTVPRGYIDCPVANGTQVVWVKPIVTCRVWFGQFDETGQLDRPKFEKLLAEIDL